jgi:hypothetical protein
MYRGSRVSYAVLYQAGARKVVVMRDELVVRFVSLDVMEVVRKLLKDVGGWRRGARRGGWMRGARHRDVLLCIADRGLRYSVTTN